MLAGQGGFSYNEFLGIPYGVVAWGLSAVFGLVFSIVQSAWVRRQIQSRLPQGVDQKSMETGFWCALARAEPGFELFGC